MLNKIRQEYGHFAFYQMGVGDLNPCIMELLDFHIGVNSLWVCQCNTWPTGLCVSHDTCSVKVRSMYCATLFFLERKVPYSDVAKWEAA
jgi:hypothetical protein